MAELSAQIKLAQKLRLKKFRAEFGLFLAEGLRLCEMAPDAEIEFGFYTPEFLASERAVQLVGRLKKIVTMQEISEAAFEKISETKTPQGILLVMRQKLSAPEEVFAKKLIVALDAVHDAGNLGTILRTAEAFSCGVVLLDDSADAFNSKVVRASMGALFNLALTKMPRAEFLALAESSGAEILAAALDSAAEIYFEQDFTKKAAVVFGSEAEGVSPEILGAARKIYIPMSGRAESLNVSAAAAIVISEAVRQRKKFF